MSSIVGSIPSCIRSHLILLNSQLRTNLEFKNIVYFGSFLPSSSLPSSSLSFPLLPSRSLFFLLVPSSSFSFPLLPSPSLFFLLVPSSFSFPLLPSRSLFFLLLPSSLLFPLLPFRSLFFPLVPLRPLLFPYVPSSYFFYPLCSSSFSFLFPPLLSSFLSFTSISKFCYKWLVSLFLCVFLFNNHCKRCCVFIIFGLTIKNVILSG